MKRPTVDQFMIAVEWLENNEGVDREGAACAAVAKWLEAQANKFLIQEAAHDCGLTVRAARQILKSRK